MMQFDVPHDGTILDLFAFVIEEMEKLIHELDTPTQEYISSNVSNVVNISDYRSKK